MRYQEIIEAVPLDPKQAMKRAERLAAARKKLADTQAQCAIRIKAAQVKLTPTT
jgi:hypothetical protein